MNLDMDRLDMDRLGMDREDDQRATPIEHVAIIMDGNGRWAQARTHRRIWGHIRGAKVVSQIVEEADHCGVKSLTLYTFSTENWGRPLEEIKILFALLKKYIVLEKKRIIKNKVRFKIMGDTSYLPRETKILIEELESATRGMSGLKLNFAFCYGGRDEIVMACNRYIAEQPGRPICEKTLSKYFLIPELPEVDLLIRTGGNKRISNFLIWQLAYADLHFTQTRWPDFTPTEFRRIYQKAQACQRRFGSIESQFQLKNSSTLMLAEKNKLYFREDTNVSQY